jgi:hypothetical protein
VDDTIRKWYRGAVCFVTALRPGSVIKDDAIPALLQTVSQPTFVTLNWSHFWQRTPPHDGFCIVCFTLPTERIGELSSRLRGLFRLDSFRTKAARMGKVARVSDEHVAYLQVRDPRTYVQPLP